MDALVRANEKLHQLSVIDGLTGVPNRRAFDLRMEEEWKKAIRQSSPISLIMLDVDHFKLYNDTYGHQQGDECLKLASKAAQSTLHRPGEELYRYGGEEFAALLPDTSYEEAIRAAETIRMAVQALQIPHAASKANSCVTVSLGVATAVPASDSSCLTLIQAADEALYMAKQAGRNRVAGADKQLSENEKGVPIH